MRLGNWFLSAAVVLVAAGGAYGVRDKFLIGGELAGAAVAAPPPFAMPVPVGKVVKKTVAIVLEYSARTEAIQSVTLQAKVSGYVIEQSHPDGSDVKAGDVLYKIDPRDYQAALDQANAQAVRDTAALDYARANAGRGTELAQTGFMAKDTVEQRTSAARQAEAALVLDQAAIRGSRLNLQYTNIIAPFDGRLGRNQAPIGALVGAGAGGVNTLVQLSPLYVTFSPSETDLVRIQEARTKGEIKADVFVPGNETVREAGKLTFLDNTVDRSTGTITARATIENSRRTWLPGQYVRVRLLLGEQPDALLVPQAALGSSQLGKYVLVVGNESKAEQRFVSLGAIEGESVVVTKGLTEADRIITGNLQKIGPGALVQPLNP